LKLLQSRRHTEKSTPPLFLHKYLQEHRQIADKLAMLRSTQEQQEREAKAAFEARKLQEQNELKKLKNNKL
jgi:hypothetical protein